VKKEWETKGRGRVPPIDSGKVARHAIHTTLVAQRGTALHGVARCCASIRERRFEDEYGSEEEEQSKEYDQKPWWERKKRLLSSFAINNYLAWPF